VFDGRDRRRAGAIVPRVDHPSSRSTVMRTITSTITAGEPGFVEGLEEQSHER
jgi:hypothetical protein